MSGAPKESASVQTLGIAVQETRAELVREFLDTEEEYCTRISLLITYYLEPFRPSQHGGRVIMRIFSNMREMAMLHKGLFEGLLSPCVEYTTVHQLAAALALAVPAMRNVYLQYYMEFADNMRLLQKKRNVSREFAVYYSEQRDECGGEDLAQLLRTPTQRMPYYTYLLQRLLGASMGEGSLERTAVAVALQGLQEACHYIDKQLERRDTKRRKALEDAGSLEEGLQASLYNVGNCAQDYEGWNVVVVGDDAGDRAKTRFISSFVTAIKKLPPVARPRFQNHVAAFLLEPPYSFSSQEVFLRLWDCTGFEQFSFLRAVNYPLADVIILTFSIGSKEQFECLIPKWYREIMLHCEHAPFLLVGLDGHLRRDKSVDERTLVPASEAMELANLLAVRYIECANDSVKETVSVFMEAASCVVYPTRYHAFKDEPREVNDATEKVLAGILAEGVDLSCQGLKGALPRPIVHCSNLQALDLSWNMFEKLPDELSRMPTLRELNLSHNQISDVMGLELLTHLTDVNLEGNQLNFLPPGLGHCTNLMVLRMADNPLDTLPKDIFPKKSFDEYKAPSSRNPLFAYLRSIQEGGQAPHNRVKVMFVGDGEVGKTSLLNCFLELQATKRKRQGSSVGLKVSRVPGKDLNEPPPITDGIQISEVHWHEGEQGKKDYVWDCWDYAGQDIYYTTHQFFLSAGAVYLVVFNLLNRDLSRVEYWLNSVHTRARGSPIVLVGTHADDPRCTSAYMKDYRRDLKDRYMKRFKSKLGVPSIKALFTLSTKPTRKGAPTEDVRALVDRIGLITEKYRLVGKLYPKSWIGLEKHLRVLSKQHDTEPLMTWEGFREIAHNCIISDEDINEAASFLHSSGVICHFNDERSGLSNLVILDPQFLTNVMSAVISLRQTFIQQGEITEKNLVFIWRGFDEQLHATLMGLLERFEIVFELPRLSAGAEARYLIPCLLPESQPSSYHQLWPAVDAEQMYQLGRVYMFKFMPLGFFSRLFVRTLHMPNVAPLAYWRTGIIIAYEGRDTALLRYNPTEYKLTMQVRGPRQSVARGQLLRLLIENVETVIEGWYETDVEISVPCSHCIEAGSYSPHMFQLQDCIEKVTEGSGHPFVLCHGVRKVRIDALAPDISFADMRTKRIDFKDLSIVSVLGIGAFGKVYEATHNGGTVAVKILEKQKKEQFSEYDEEDDEEFKRFNEFQREVWIMSCIRHTNLVQLKGLCTNPPAMVMEILRLGDLYHILYPKPAPKPPHEDDPEKREQHAADMGRWEKMQALHATLRDGLELRLKIGLDIAKGMRYLHSLSPPIIHRDLRSPNIFMVSLDVEEETVAKVGDFGLSRLVATTLAGGDFNVNWLAPEVMREEQYTEKMDTYSFGIILWELIALEPPFAEYDKKYQGRPREVFKKAVIDGLRPTIPQECPASYAALVQECWAADPSSRPSFVEVVRRLVAVMDELGFYAEEEDIEECGAEEEEAVAPEPPLEIQCSAEVMRLDSVLEPKHQHTVQCLLVVATTVWAGCRNGVIRIWDIESGEFLEEFMANSSKSGICAMQLISGFVWTAFDNGAITAFDTASSNRSKGFRGHRVSKAGKREEKPGVRCLMPLRGFSDLDPKAKHLRVLSGEFAGALVLWKAKKRSPSRNTHEKVAVFDDTGVESLYQDNDRVWVGLRNFIYVLDSKTWTTVAKWKAHRGSVNAFVGLGTQVWSGGHDGSVAVWDTASVEEYANGEEPEKRIAAHTSKVYALARVGDYVVSGSFDMSVVAYDAQSLQVLQEEKEHKDGVRALVTVNPTTFWSGSMQRDGTVCSWKLKDA